MKIRLCFIREEFFIEHLNYVNLLDTDNTKKQSHRTHLCLWLERNNNHFFIPLRNNLGPEIRKYGRIGHSVPSKKRENAGLDYRYAMIINDENYIEWQLELKIPNAQYRQIENAYESIMQEFDTYLSGYIKAVKKKRVSKEPLYRFSSLQNFNSELGL